MSEGWETVKPARVAQRRSRRRKGDPDTMAACRTDRPRTAPSSSAARARTTSRTCRSPSRSSELIVVTGVSGSGKSSLVFDTLYAEGQRRYVETFSPYARQFLDRMDKPQVDRIDGIPPAIAIDQTNPVRTSRSTVGTMTELNDHLKLLFARAAQLYCRGCGGRWRATRRISIYDATARARAQARAIRAWSSPSRSTVPKNFSEARSSSCWSGRATRASTPATRTRSRWCRTGCASARPSARA